MIQQAAQAQASLPQLQVCGTPPRGRGQRGHHPQHWSVPQHVSTAPLLLLPFMKVQGVPRLGRCDPNSLLTRAWGVCTYTFQLDPPPEVELLNHLLDLVNASWPLPKRLNSFTPSPWQSMKTWNSVITGYLVFSWPKTEHKSRKWNERGQWIEKHARSRGGLAEWNFCRLQGSGKYVQSQIKLVQVVGIKEFSSS